ncbi:MAG TPA: type I-U CRISPR-associated helicase/endonuclease Cas3, partial [Bryobacteraceae bacterium]|nr:type I-U CRISPR-associated helicase/endonuclease Cas3 [Bryobacteraceae bacterium]
APFCETAHAIANRWQHFAEQPVGPDLLLVRMSATPGEGADFELDDEDRKDEILKLRLQASKTAELVNIKANREKSRAGLVEETIRRSQRLLDSMTGGVLGIVLNRVADARSVFEQLQIPENRKILLTGRARGWERDRLLEQWMPLLRADSHEQADSPLAVIATQCIEVGANLDFDYLVTEIAPLDTLRQRFGRVDRLGRRNDRLQYLGDRAAMPGMILATAAQIEGDGNEAKFEDRVYGHALHRTWMWLNERGLADPRCVDFGIDAMDSILPEGEDLARLCQNVSRAFPLLPAYLDILAQTNPPPQPEPEIAAFLHGMTQAAPDVTLVWRRDLPENDPDLWPDRAALQPPVTGEGCPVPIWEFRRWLTGARPAEDSGDVEALAAEDEPNSGPGRVLRWRGPQDAKVLAGGDVAPGDTVIVPSAYGGCDAFGWNPASVAPVTDIGDAVAFDAGRRPVLRLAAITAESAQAAVSGLKSWAQGEEDAPDPREALERLASLPDVPQWLPTLARTLLADGRRRLIEASGAYAIAGRRSRGEDLSTSDDGSALGASVELMNHCDGVSDYAKRFAGALGLPETLVDDIGLAALMHDFGKADPRFQVWLYNGDHIAAALGGAVLAKSGENPRNRAAIRRARKRAGYPENGRHEAQSLALIQSRPEISAMANDWDLVRHLVASHHGFARPLLPVIADPEPVEVALDFNDLRLSCTSDHGLYKLDSGVGERYWRLTQRYGWWGLAWLETILRLADHRCSEVEQQ